MDENLQVPDYQLLTMKRLRQVLDALGRERRSTLIWTGVLVRMTGDHALAAVLDQALAWQRVKDRAAPDTWWYKTDAEWEAEIGVGRKAMARARGVLPACGVTAEKRRAPGGNECVWHYRVDWAAFVRRLAASLSTTVEKIFATIEKLIAMERIAAERQVASLLAAYGVGSVPSGQFKVSQVDSSNMPDGTVQSVPSGQVEVSQADTTLIHPDLPSESSSGSASGSPPLQGARVSEEAIAGVGVFSFPLPSLQSFLQVRGDAHEDATAPSPPGAAPPPSPPEWALAVALHKQTRGELRSGDPVPYAWGMVRRQQQATAPVKQALAGDLEMFITE